MDIHVEFAHVIVHKTYFSFHDLYELHKSKVKQFYK